MADDLEVRVEAVDETRKILLKPGEIYAAEHQDIMRRDDEDVPWQQVTVVLVFVFVVAMLLSDATTGI